MQIFSLLVALAYASPITIRVLMFKPQQSGHQISNSNEADCGDVSHSSGDHRHTASMSSILKPLLGFMLMKSMMNAMAAKHHQASLPKSDLKLQESRQITFQ